MVLAIRWLAMSSAMSLCLSACAHRASVPVPFRASVPVPLQDKVDPAALADRIDPGPLPSLLDDMPGWLEILLAGGDPDMEDPQKFSDRAHQILDEWENGPPAISMDHLETLVELIQGFLVMERWSLSGAPCNTRCLAVRALIYNALDIPMFADREGFMYQLLSFLSSALQGEVLTKDQTAELLDFLESIFKKAPRHHQRIAARILREAPHSQEASDALYQLAGRAAGQQEDFERAALLYNASISLSHEEVDGARWLCLANSCYRTFQFSCGDQALQAARKAYGDSPGEDAETGIQAAEDNRVAAEKIRGFGKRNDIESKLEYADLHFELGHTRKAGQMYEAIRNEYPDDARPYPGLARVALSKNLRGAEATRIIHQATDKKNKNLDYYEVLVGTAFNTFIVDVLTPVAKDPDRLAELMEPFLVSLRKDIEGLARFAPERAAVLGLMVDTGSSLVLWLKSKEAKDEPSKLEGFITRAYDRAAALQARYPKQTETHRLTCLLASFLADRQKAFAATLAEPGKELAEREELQLLRAKSLYRLIASWRDETHLPVLERLVETLDRTPPAKHLPALNLEADTAALRARLHDDKGAWARAEKLYRTLLEHSPSDQRARLRNNLAVALFEQGHSGPAVENWRASLREKPEYEVPQVNRHIAKPESDSTAKLEAYGREAGLEGLRYQARAWAIHRTALDKKEIERRMKEARSELSTNNPMGMNTSGGAGALVAGAFNIGFGYSTEKRLVIQLDMSPEIWLVIPAPATRSSVP